MDYLDQDRQAFHWPDSPERTERQRLYHETMAATDAELERQAEAEGLFYDRHNGCFRDSRYRFVRFVGEDCRRRIYNRIRAARG